MPVVFPKAVVDAGPLFTVITLSFARKYKRDFVLGRANLPRDTEGQDAYFLLFADIGTVLTTSHVVGELQGLSSRLRLRELDFENFWLSAIDFLRTKNFDERLIRLLAMDAEERLSRAVCIFGPPDAGLIELARKKECPLFTDDGRLRDFAGRINVRCELVQELVRARR